MLGNFPDHAQRVCQQLAGLVRVRGEFALAVTNAESSEPRGWLLLALLLVVLAAVYAPTLGAPLVWDDTRLILESAPIRSLELRHAFLEPFWPGTPGEPGTIAFFRP